MWFSSLDSYFCSIAVHIDYIFLFLQKIARQILHNIIVTIRRVLL